MSHRAEWHSDRGATELIGGVRGVFAVAISLI
jgi:hypothetical protein